MTCKTEQLIIISVALTLFFGCGNQQKSEQKKDGIPVTVSQVNIRDVVHRLHRVGSLEAKESVVLKAEINERVTGIFFEEGDTVESGRILVKLNDAKVRAQTDELKSRLQQWVLQLANSKKTLARKKPLVKKNLVSGQEFDDLQTKIEVEKATIKEIKAQLAYTSELFKNTEIRAPFDGATSERKISVGDFLKPGNPIVRMMQLDPLEISFRVDEKYKTRIFLSQPVETTVTAQPKRKFDGKIYFISPDIDVATRTFLIKARITNKEGLLNPGMFAHVTITIETHKNALVIPWECVVQLEDETYVYVLNNNKAKKIPVQLLLIEDGMAEVLGDLEPHMKIVVEGKYSLKDGVNVSIKK